MEPPLETPNLGRAVRLTWFEPDEGHINSQLRTF